MRGVLLAVAMAGAISPMRGASGNFNNCPNQPGTPVWTLPVRVLTAKLQLFDGLRATDLSLQVDRVPREVCGFEYLRRPVSVGILFDNSASMRGGDRGELAKAAVDRFLDLAGPQDEFFLESVNDKASVRVPFTSAVASIRAGLTAPPGRNTALLDALCLGLNEMRKARHSMRVLLVLSDGEDNSSLYGFSDFKAVLASNPVPVFFLTPADAWRHSPDTKRDEMRKDLLVGMVHESGGYIAMATGHNKIMEAAADLAAAIRMPYILYFTGAPSDTPPRNLRVEVKGLRPPPLLLYGQPQACCR